MGTRGVSAAEVGMAKKKNQAARGGRAKPKTTTNSKKSNAGAPSGTGRASQAIGVVFMALGVLYVGSVYAGKTAYIYLMDADAAKYSLIKTMNVNETGNVAIDTEQFTDVIIMIAE